MLRRFAVLLCVLGAWAVPASGQTLRAPHLQAGLGVLPGIGVQAGYLRPHGFYTVESILYAEGSPGFAVGRGSMEIGAGLGGSIRVFGLLRMIGSPRYAGRDLDIGLRFGPSLFLTPRGSNRTENPFSLFMEPFVRASATFRGNRFFAETGVHRPFLRAGVWLEM